MKKNSIIGTLIIGLIFTPIGYFVAFHFGKPILDNARASSTWPSVDGVVERSKVVTKRDRDRKTMYSAEVAYRYTVDGKELRGNTVAFGGDFSSSSSSYAYSVTNRYPVNQAVKVHYEPENPGNSVLEPGVTWKSYMVFGVGLIFLVVGVLLLGGQLSYFAIGMFVVAGAASGAIGRRKNTSKDAYQAPPIDQTSPQRPAAPPSRDAGDDGFDVG